MKYLFLILALSGCGSESNVGTQCTEDDECSDGLTCMDWYQVTVSSGGFSSCDSHFKICSQSCSADEDCADVGGSSCVASTTCGGPKNLCYR